MNLTSSKEILTLVLVFGGFCRTHNKQKIAGVETGREVLCDVRVKEAILNVSGYIVRE